MLLSWFATWVARRERRSLKTKAVDIEIGPDDPATTVLPGRI